MRFFLSIVSILILLSISTYTFANQDQSLKDKFQTLEKSFDGKIGVYAIDTNNGQIIAHRENERFPVQSTFKLIGAAALLKKSSSNKNLLTEKIYYTKKDLIGWHPVTGKYLKEGMTLEALSEATITYSDDPAINLMMKKWGGPLFVTDFARSIGNKTFHVEHYENHMNSNPEDQHDTSTPRDMAISLQKITLGDILTKNQRTQLLTWMRNDTVGYQRIRAGIPMGWTVADKTGSGDYGVANDIGIVWSPSCKPIVLSIYTVQHKKDAKRRDDILASATKIVMDEFAKQDKCFNDLNN